MKRKIYSAYTDASVRLGAAHTMYLVQDALSRWQRDQLCGNCEIREKGLFWVVTKSKVKFHRFPMWDSEVDVTFGFAPAGRIRCEFCVDITDDDGSAVEVRQEYCILDFERHRPQKLEGILTPDLPAQQPAGYEKFEIEQADLCHTVTVLPHMIDMSGHLNNVEYVKLALDCFDGKFLSENEPAEMECHHLKECKEGETLTLWRKDEGNTSYCQILREETPVFEIKFVWREKI